MLNYSPYALIKKPPKKYSNVLFKPKSFVKTNFYNILYLFYAPFQFLFYKSTKFILLIYKPIARKPYYYIAYIEYTIYYCKQNPKYKSRNVFIGKVTFYIKSNQI